jgi:hypothetical protein
VFIGGRLKGTNFTVAEDFPAVTFRCPSDYVLTIGDHHCDARGRVGLCRIERAEFSLIDCSSGMRVVDRVCTFGDATSIDV